MVGEAVGGQPSEAAAVRDDGEPVARERLDAPERLGRVEQFVDIGDSQQAGAAERRVIDRVGPRHVRDRRAAARTALVTAGFHDDHGFDARCRARGGHEFLRVLETVDVEQDGARRDIEREIVE